MPREIPIETLWRRVEPCLPATRRRSRIDGRPRLADPTFHAEALRARSAP